MKNAFIYVKDKSEFSFSDVSSAVNSFSVIGMEIDSVSILSCTDDLAFKRQLSNLKSTMDNLIVIVPNDVEFDIKAIIAEEMESELMVSDNAVKFIEAVCKAKSQEIDKENALLPVDATLIPNVNGTFQGFMMEDKEFSLVVLPSNSKEFSVTCSGYVIPYFENKYDIKTDKFIFKYFGSEQLLIRELDSINADFNNSFKYSVSEKYGDCLVNLYLEKDKVSLKSEILRAIILKLKDNVYAEFDTGLSQRVFDLLKLKNKKISVAESFTAGRIVSALVENSGASAFVNEGVVSYSNISKVKRLKVKESDLISVGAVSPQVAYQMSAGLLTGGDCDIAISTTGIAGPKSDDTLKPVGLCYIGIGMKDGIHVYKYNFSGDRETVTETAKNTALFLAIKKLKNL